MHTLEKPETNKLLIDILYRTKFEIFGGYLNILDSKVFVSTNLIGDVFAFLGQGKYPAGGYWLYVAVGTDDDFALYKMSLASEDYFYKNKSKKTQRISIPVVIKEKCCITENQTDCYEFHIRLVGTFDFCELQIPFLNFNSKIRYMGKDAEIRMIQGDRLYAIRTEDGEYTVTAIELDILTVENTYAPIKSYVSDWWKEKLPEPQKSNNSYPMLTWDYHFPQGQYCHYWANTYARTKQIIPVPKRKED